MGHPVQTCLDPFGGSGTTALSCQFLGVLPTTIEVNPYLADLIQAKLTSYNVDLLIRDFEKVIRPSKKGSGKKLAARWRANLPPTFVAPGVNGNYIFSRAIGHRLAVLFDRISKLKSHKSRRLLRVLLASRSIEVSNITVSGKGRRYRSSWKSTRNRTDVLDQLLSASVSAAIYDISRFSNRKEPGFKLFRGDARRLVGKAAQTDLVVFSPPYPNSFDYTDVYNVELWVGGYLASSADNRSLRLKTLRSHVQVHRSFEHSAKSSATLRKTIAALRRRKSNLWNKNIPDMVGAYFDDLEEILTGIKAKLSAQGRAYIVVGDSKYAGVEINVSKILSEISESAGLKPLSIRPFRSMRSSPQQGGKEELSETLLVLKKP